VKELTDSSRKIV